jgi:hypothetical protein
MVIDSRKLFAFAPKARGNSRTKDFHSRRYHRVVAMVLADSPPACARDRISSGPIR